MDEVVQQNSALVEENAATAKLLEHQARGDERADRHFQVDVTARASRAVAGR
jgi:methyl-accepting chemotaxis protein